MYGENIYGLKPKKLNSGNKKKIGKIVRNIIIAFIIFWIIAIIFVNVVDKKSKKEEETNIYEVISNKSFSKIYTVNDGYLIVKDNDKVKIANEKGDIIEDITSYVPNQYDASSNNENNPVLGYDGYYALFDEENIYIKKNGKEVEKIEKNKEYDYKLLKSENSKYIAFNEKGQSAKIIGENAYIVNKVKKNYITTVFNITTGEKVKTFDGYVNDLYMNKKINDEYLTLSNSKGIALLSKKTLKEGSYYKELGDKNQKTVSDQISSKSEKYLAALKCTKTCNSNNPNYKYGITDLRDNEIVSFKYDETVINSSKDEYFEVKSGNKYGVINNKNEKVVPFEYSSAPVFDNYIITTQNNSMFVLDYNLKQINANSYTVYNSKCHVMREYKTKCDSYSATNFGNALYINTFDYGKKYLNETPNNNFNNNILVTKEKIIQTKNSIKLIDDSNNYTNKKYIVEEKIIDNIKSLTIYNEDLKETNIDIKLDKKTKPTYSMADSDKLFINADTNYLVNISDGSVVYTNEEANNYKALNYAEENLEDGLTYVYDNGDITIKKGENEITKLKGTKIIYLSKKHYVVINDDKYEFIKFN